MQGSSRVVVGALWIVAAVLSCTAVLWASSGREAGAQTAPGDGDFEQVTLAKGGGVLGEPIAMAVLPNGNVLSTARDGAVNLTTLGGVTTQAAKVPVYSHDEDGLQGVAIDPDFAQNNWVYLYYAPQLNTPTGDAPNDAGDPSAFEPYAGHNQLSRVKMVGNKLDLTTEQKILQVPADRGMCCHAGGEIDFDAEGNLYLSTGDDANPFQSDGYTPIDERATRNPSFDAQRSSANTNDLRGKLLRIEVQADGSYTVPEGNLYGPGGEYPDADPAKVRPEIYAMGFRNPFRFAVDRETGWVYLGDYGPDASSANANRGPGGQVEFNLIKEPGNYGWPYCIGDNVAYNDYNFATGQSGAKFDCQAPVNESPRNTGLRQLPPVEPAWIPYDGGSVPEFAPHSSESPMGGPTYNFDPNLQSDVKFPQYYDGKNFAYEWGRRWIKTITVGPNGERGAIDPFFESMQRTQLMNIEFGPDGSLYVLDYGTGFFSGDENSAIYKINYVKGSRSPVAVTKADKDSGLAPLTVQFSSEGSRDPDGEAITYSWDFDGDGTEDSTQPNPTYTYTQNGDYNALLTVKDSTGKTGTSQVNVAVGNSKPRVEIELPTTGDFYEYGDQIPYRVTVTDAEDGQIDCSRVKVDSALGHADHTHGDQSATGCQGTFTVPPAWEPPEQRTFYIINASYTDGGGESGSSPLTATSQAILRYKTLQAEHFSAQQGTQVVNHGGAVGGQRVGYIDNGDWLAFEPVNLSDMESATVRGSGGGGGTIQFRWNAPDGPTLATATMPNTGGPDNYVTLDPVPLQGAPNETGTLYLVFSGGIDVDQVTFNSDGASIPGRPQASATATPKQGQTPLEVDFDGTATDPDGEALTYEWDFDSDGTVDATTEDATFTYDQPGKYTATFTATDPGGLSRKATVNTTVFAPDAACDTPGSDEFDGADLDKSRWSAIVREDASRYSVGNGALTIDSARGDMYGGDTTAKNLIMQPAPDGAWVARTKVTADTVTNYQQAGMMVYGSDQEFVKLSWLDLGGGNRKFEFVRQANGQPRSEPADGTEDLPADFPDTVFLEIRSDGTNLTGAYSVDGENWTPVGRSTDFERMGDQPKVGVFAINPGTDQSFRGVFERFTIAGPDDEFDGGGLMKCRWTEIVRENQAGYRVADGSLKIDTGNNTDMYGGNTSAENLILQRPPGEAWEATTRVALDFKKTYEQAGMMVYGSDREWVKLTYIQMPDGRKIEFLKQQNGEPEAGSSQEHTPVLGSDVPNALFLRVASDGTDLRAFWSVDGEDWTEIGQAPLAGIPDPQIGLAAFNGNGSGNEAGFDFFRVSENATPRVSASATPVRGDAPLKVDFDGTATDPKGQQLTYEWDFDSDGTVDATTEDATFTYNDPGTYKATLTATTADGRKGSGSTEVVVSEPCATPSRPEAGYKSLFDGTDASLQDWKQAGGGGFERQGCAMKSVGDFGLFWHTNDGQEFEAPYSLKLDWMKPGDDNSGVFVGFGDPGNDPMNAVREGEEVQIDSTDNPAQTTGAIYLEQAPDAAARDAALKPDGEWNEYEIKVETDRIVVILNGVKINEWTDDDPNVDLATGFIGVQSHGFSGSSPDEVFFRNIRINDGSTPVDAEAPQTTITNGPSGTTRSSSATFAFDSSESDSTFECSLNGSAFAACESPASFEDLPNGGHTFRVRATDAAGNTDATPASRTWMVDSTKPVVRGLAPRDGSSVRDRTPVVQAFARDAASDLSKADLDLYVDGRRRTTFAYDRGTDRLRFTSGTLPYGGHSVRVVATDGAGNVAVDAWRFRVVRP